MGTNPEKELQNAIEEWIASLEGKTPTIEQVMDVFGNVGQPSIEAYCHSFADASSFLALILQGMISLQEKMSVDNESAKIVLEGEVIEQLKGAVEDVLRHVNVSENSVEMIEVPHIEVPPKDEMN